MKPTQIRLQTYRQCYRGKHELGRWTSRITAIVAAKARIGGKTIAEISSSTRNSSLRMHTLFLSEKTKHNFPDAEILQMRIGPMAQCWGAAIRSGQRRRSPVANPRRTRMSSGISRLSHCDCQLAG